MQSGLPAGLPASTFAPDSLHTADRVILVKSPGQATPLASFLRVKTKVLPEAYKVNMGSLPTPTSLWAHLLLLTPHLHHSRHCSSVLRTHKPMSPPLCLIQGLCIRCSFCLKCSFPRCTHRSSRTPDVKGSFILYHESYLFPLWHCL